MVDLALEMAQLWASLRGTAKGQARAIQFVSARGGEGASTVAREFARYASRHVRKPVWLVDLDVMESPQTEVIAAEAGRYGALGRQTAASPDGSTFFTVQPPTRHADGRLASDSNYLSAYPVGGPLFWVTRFRRELLHPPQAVQILPKPDYWKALRRHADLIVVDSPSTDRSTAALTVAPFMDFSVLVVAADEGDVAAPGVLKDSIIASGGRCAGLVFNRATARPPGFLKTLMP